MKFFFSALLIMLIGSTFLAGCGGICSLPQDRRHGAQFYAPHL